MQGKSVQGTHKPFAISKMQLQWQQNAQSSIAAGTKLQKILEPLMWRRVNDWYVYILQHILLYICMHVSYTQTTGITHTANTESSGLVSNAHQGRCKLRRTHPCTHAHTRAQTHKMDQRVKKAWAFHFWLHRVTWNLSACRTMSSICMCPRSCIHTIVWLAVPSIKKKTKTKRKHYAFQHWSKKLR